MRAAKFVANPVPILDGNLKTYGPTYQFHIGGLQPGLVTIEPKVIQHVLQKNHRNYRKSAIQTGILAHYVGCGLLTSDGPYWLRQRRLIQPGFHRERLAAIFTHMNTEVDLYIRRLKETIKEQPTINLSRDMHRLAFRIIAKALFSKALSEENLALLSNQITELQSYIIREIRQPFLRWWFQLSGQRNRYEKLAHDTKSIIRELINERIHTPEKEDDLLQMLLDARYADTGEEMSAEQVLDESLILFVAGHETAANALSWTFYLLAQHEDRCAALQRESDAIFNDQIPSFSMLPRLSYATQVIEEAMRLYPPAWVIDRVALEDDEVSGYHIAKNTLMILFVYGAHRNPKFWTSPDAFDPTRFSHENKGGIEPFTYFPFGGGPRMCIGNNFAMMEMQLIVSRLSHHFNFELVNKSDPGLMPMITLRSSSDIYFKVQPRRDHVVQDPFI
ncbi:MAG: cytochrome P450 [Saprospiraceae bacterium]|nr:cytochrome P450 [Saprospiraceae bacterium]